MSPTREMSRFGGGPMTPTYVDSRSTRKQHFECVRRANRRLQSWSPRLGRAELRTEERLYFCELPDSPTSGSEPLSTIESDENVFDHGALTDWANLRDQVRQTNSLIKAQSWSHGPSLSFAKSLARSLVEVFPRFVGSNRVFKFMVPTLNKCVGHNSHTFRFNDTSHALLRTSCGNCISSRREHVEATRRNVRRASIGKNKASTSTLSNEKKPMDHKRWKRIIAMKGASMKGRGNLARSITLQRRAY